MLVAGLTHHLKGKLMENMTVPEAGLLAAGGLEEGVHFPCIDLPPGAVIFIEGGAWREVHSFPARRTYTLHMAHMVHAWLAEKKKNGNFRWTWYPPRFPHRRTVVGKMPLNLRKVFF